MIASVTNNMPLNHSNTNEQHLEYVRTVLLAFARIVSTDSFAGVPAVIQERPLAFDTKLTCVTVARVPISDVRFSDSLGRGMEGLELRESKTAWTSICPQNPIRPGRHFPHFQIPPTPGGSVAQTH